MKTNEDRMIRIANLAEEHYGNGEVKFVGVKFDPENKVFVSKLKLQTQMSIYESGVTSEDSLKKLKLRIKKIIKRYGAV